MRTYLLLFTLLFYNSVSESKEIIGIYERVKINAIGLVFHAKIDTGAKNSSLNARNIHIVNKDGEEWVKFEITNREGKSAILERPLERIVEIKRKKQESQTRPAVLLKICLGGVLRQVEVNLVDRSNFNYQMLIGRSYMSGNFIIDVEKSYTREPHC